MSFIFVEVDPYDAGTIRETTAIADIPVRRPIMGLMAKQQVFSKIQILEPQPQGAGISWLPILNSSTRTGYGDGTSNFFLSRATIPLRERIQITSTFERDYLYAFGKAPTMVQVLGVLLDSEDFPWTTEWLRNYDDYFRASQTLDRMARLYLTVGDLLIEGHMISCQISKEKESNHLVPLVFVLYVSDIIYTGDEHYLLTEQDLGANEPGEDGALYGHSAEYLEAPLFTTQALQQTFQLGSEQSSGLPGEFFVDETGNIRLQAVGGITSRSEKPDLFQRLEVEQMVAAAAFINENLGGNLDLGAIRRAFELVRLAELGFGFGDADSLGDDAGTLRRLLDSGTGGYMTQLESATDELLEAFEEI